MLGNYFAKNIDQKRFKNAVRCKRGFLRCFKKIDTNIVRQWLELFKIYCRRKQVRNELISLGFFTISCGFSCRDFLEKKVHTLYFRSFYFSSI